MRRPPLFEETVAGALCLKKASQGAPQKEFFQKQ
jgi:hypothetical protein